MEKKHLKHTSSMSFRHAIQGFVLDGKVVGIELKRQTIRKLPKKEKEYEKEFLDDLKQQNYDETKSISYNWLKETFNITHPNKGISSKNALRIARFFSFYLNISIGREVYRRRKTILFWLDNNLDLISELLKKHEVKINLDGALIPLKPPQDFDCNQNAPSAASEEIYFSGPLMDFDLEEGYYEIE